MKKEILDKFWNLYDEEGAIPALSWLETLKYYEDYCNNNIVEVKDAMEEITSSIYSMNINK